MFSVLILLVLSSVTMNISACEEQTAQPKTIEKCYWVSIPKKYKKKNEADSSFTYDIKCELTDVFSDESCDFTYNEKNIKNGKMIDIWLDNPNWQEKRFLAFRVKIIGTRTKFIQLFRHQTLLNKLIPDPQERSAILTLIESLAPK